MIYLDNNATTPLDSEVIESMEAVYHSTARNPSSTHRFGQKAKATLAQAMHTIASYFKVSSQELLFTSGATEAITMVLKSFFPPPFKGHLITSSIEHIALYNTAKWLEKQGVRVTFLNPKPGRGAVEKDQVEDAVCPDTRLIALAGANSETGIKIDIDSIAALAKEKNVPFFVDGVALLGKDAFSLSEGISAICFSGHKIHGPLGVGLLILRKGVSLHPLILGGPQQHGLRGGTENVPAIVGFAKALELLKNKGEAMQHMRHLRDLFENELINAHPSIVQNGEGPRIANTSNLSFPKIDGEMLLMHLDLAGVAASFGSACSSGSLEPSRVLSNMGLPKERVDSSLRFSLSRLTTEEEIKRAVEIISKTLLRLHV